ncbi:hypothetical protein KAU51_00535 [Candidatus Parcubacteria bacterium]|nr:hypothetical protein [Candidatus Parcubacteria bacterium]
MEIIDEVAGEALKAFAKQKIIEVFDEEVQIYAKQLEEIKPSHIRMYIYYYLDGKVAASEKVEQIIEIFEQRVKFYSTEYPLLSEPAIKEVIKKYLVNRV